MSDKRGLYGKYIVLRTKHLEHPQLLADQYSRAVVRDACFVLKLDDPHARVALRAYADSVSRENVKLAFDINAQIERAERDSQ